MKCKSMHIHQHINRPCTQLFFSLNVCSWVFASNATLRLQCWYDFFLCRSVKSEHMSCCVVVRRFVSWLEWGCARVCVCAFVGSAGWVQQCYVFLQSQCVAAMQSDTHSSDQYKGSAWERGGLSFRGGRGACLIWGEFYSSQYIHWSGTHISVC